MTIKVGKSLPAAVFQVLTEDGPADLSVEGLCKGRKVVLFGLPGAFTPTCHNNHVPGFLDNLDAIKAKGVDAVGVVSVNDVWVMGAWAEATRGKGRIEYLADGAATFTKAIGLEIVDPRPTGMGMRSKRYSMIVDDGLVTTLNIEQVRGQAIASGAATILEQL